MSTTDKDSLRELENELTMQVFGQEKAIKALRKSRDSKKTDRALSKLQSAADTDENLMPLILNSVKAYATTGEISNTLREVFGEYRPKEIF